MGLEDEINQKKFKSELQKAFVNVTFTNSYVGNQINQALKTYQISQQQFNVLRILKGQHPVPISVNEITKRMVDKMSNASRLVDKLFAKNLVNKNVCGFDKRQVDITINKRGINILLELNQLVDEVLSKHNHLTEEDCVQLNILLDKIRKR